MKSKKTALLHSIISLLLCVSMLCSTTFAWFTDSVTTGMNTIAAGNLDVELLANGTRVESATPLFQLKDPNLWEPGVVAYENLQVANVGTLALKYQMRLNFGNENELDGHKLSEVLQVAVVDKIADNASRADVLAAARASAKVSTLSEFYVEGELEAGTNAAEQTVVIFWEPNDNATDNLYNVNNGQKVSDYDAALDNNQLRIEFGVKLLATQLMSEEDSFGKDYDEEATLPPADAVMVSSQAELLEALEGDGPIWLNDSFSLTEAIKIAKDVTINGNGCTLSRAAGYDGNVFVVQNGASLVLENITVDGGAVWTGAVDPVLNRGTVNTGVTATGNLVAAEANAKITLGKGAVLQNNDGANAVNLGTRVGATLTLNGGEIINNHSAAGAIWGGGEITVNSGKINGNHGGIGGAIRVVTNVGTVLTMNGGEMNHNKSDDVGGAVWAGSSRSNNVYVLNGGEVAYNYSPVAGGAMYAGYYETVKIGGSFSMHDNSAPVAGAIRFHNHASFEMTGGEIYDNGDNSLFLMNNSASITGGTISDSFGYGGGLNLTIGEATVEEPVAFDLTTNHNTAYLADKFNSFKFTVNEAGNNFANFNFKPAAGYTYTEGDEAKLVCMNAGYETYWDAATGTFRLQAK